MGLLVLLCWVYSGPPHRGYRCTAGPVRQEDLPKAGYAAPLHPHYLGQQRAHGAIDAPRATEPADPPPSPSGVSGYGVTAAQIHAAVVAELARSGGRLYHCPGCQCGRGNDVDTMRAGT